MPLLPNTLAIINQIEVALALAVGAGLNSRR